MIVWMGKASRKKWEQRIKVALAGVRSGQKPPWYESNLFWGPISLLAAFILPVVAVMKDLRWLLWVAWGCSALCAWTVCKNIPGQAAKWFCFFIVVIAAGLGFYKANNLLEPMKEISKEIPKRVSLAVFMECQMSGLPVTIPARSTLHVIALNKKRMERDNWGFYQIPNHAEKEVTWPATKKLDLSRKLHNFGTIAYACEVTNLGSETINYLAVPIDITFASDKKTIKYRPIVSALGIGKSFPFYVVNDCPAEVAAVWQDIPTKISILGESTPREIILKRKYKNPVEQMMIFFPSSVKWTGEQPCE